MHTYDQRNGIRARLTADTAQRAAIPNWNYTVYLVLSSCLPPTRTLSIVVCCVSLSAHSSARANLLQANARSQIKFPAAGLQKKREGLLSPPRSHTEDLHEGKWKTSVCGILLQERCCPCGHEDDGWQTGLKGHGTHAPLKRNECLCFPMAVDGVPGNGKEKQRNPTHDCVHFVLGCDSLRVRNPHLSFEYI